MKLALLLALIMPLQGFASAWSCGSFDAAPAAAAQHCAHEDGAAQQHHHCGTCCAAAIAVMPLLWVPPRPENAGSPLPLRSSPPAIALDRLDRPPRFVS
jgi:hypothetical protein